MTCCPLEDEKSPPPEDLHRFPALPRESVRAPRSPLPKSCLSHCGPPVGIELQQWG